MDPICSSSSYNLANRQRPTGSQKATVEDEPEEPPHTAFNRSNDTTPERERQTPPAYVSKLPDDVEGGGGRLSQSVINLPDDTDIPDPEKSQDTQPAAGSMVAKENVKWYREGASLRKVDDGVEICPNGEPISATLFGTYNREGRIDPNSCFLHVPGGTRHGFKSTHQLGGGHSFGSLKPDKGSTAFLKKGVEVDSEAQIIEGTHATDYVQYGQETIPFLPGYSLS